MKKTAAMNGLGLLVLLVPCPLVSFAVEICTNMLGLSDAAIDSIVTAHPFGYYWSSQSEGAWYCYSTTVITNAQKLSAGAGQSLGDSITGAYNPTMTDVCRTASIITHFDTNAVNEMNAPMKEFWETERDAVERKQFRAFTNWAGGANTWTGLMANKASESMAIFGEIDSMTENMYALTNGEGANTAVSNSIHWHEPDGGYLGALSSGLSNAGLTADGTAPEGFGVWESPLFSTFAPSNTVYMVPASDNSRLQIWMYRARAWMAWACVVICFAHAFWKANISTEKVTMNWIMPPPRDDFKFPGAGLIQGQISAMLVTAILASLPVAILTMADLQMNIVQGVAEVVQNPLTVQSDGEGGYEHGSTIASDVMDVIVALNMVLPLPEIVSAAATMIIVTLTAMWLVWWSLTLIRHLTF